MIDKTKLKQIKEKLSILEENNNFTICHAVLTGSRMWGYNKENSDYDIRFIYKKPILEYMSLLNKSKLTYHEVDRENGLDIQGWDVKTYLLGLCKSNFNNYDLLYSNLLISNNERFTQSLQELAKDKFNLKTLSYQAYGMLSEVIFMEKWYQKDKNIILAMREILLFEWYQECLKNNQYVLPSLDIHKLRYHLLGISTEQFALIDLIHFIQKPEGRDLDRIKFCRETLISYIESMFNQIKKQIKSEWFNQLQVKDYSEEIKDFYHQYLITSCKEI